MTMGGRYDHGRCGYDDGEAAMTMGGAGMRTGWDRLAWNSLEKPGGDDGKRGYILDSPETPFCRSSGGGA